MLSIVNKPNLTQMLACPQCQTSLIATDNGLDCPNGHHYPVVRGIPRFVSNDHYVSSFSFEWNIHCQTQLDTYRHDSSSEEMFGLKTGLKPSDVQGKLMLDAGIGAGRFTDTAARWGANIIGIDLSYAVEAAHNNFQHLQNVLVAQADIKNLPFKPETFDFIISIGTLHHTPDTRKYFQALIPFLKHGGTICIWVYPSEGDYLIRKEWIRFTSLIPNQVFYEWCRWFVPLASRHRDNSLTRWIYQVFPFSNQKLGLENDILDTFDGYSPKYHGTHSPEEVESWFADAGLINISRPSSWNTCVRGMRP